MLFLDASALVKRYVVEPGSDVVEAAIAKHDTVIVAWLSFAECLAAFSRRRRDKSLSRAEVELAIKRFASDWQKLVVLHETRELEPVVAALLARQPLRASDAVQLGAALFLRAAGLDVRWLCFDQRLVNIACEEGLAAADP